MNPYPDPTTGYEWGPQTALTPKLVAHGSQSNFRILKGNPAGFAISRDGEMHAYLSARMEHSHQPLEHAMLGSVDLDHYRLGQSMPARMQPGPERRIQPDPASLFSWPDTSVSSGFHPHENPLAGPHPGRTFGPGQPYFPEHR